MIYSTYGIAYGSMIGIILLGLLFIFTLAFLAVCIPLTYCRSGGKSQRRKKKTSMPDFPESDATAAVPMGDGREKPQATSVGCMASIWQKFQVPRRWMFRWLSIFLFLMGCIWTLVFSFLSGFGVLPIGWAIMIIVPAWLVVSPTVLVLTSVGIRTLFSSHVSRFLGNGDMPPNEEVAATNEETRRRQHANTITGLTSFRRQNGPLQEDDEKAVPLLVDGGAMSQASLSHASDSSMISMLHHSNHVRSNKNRTTERARSETEIQRSLAKLERNRNAHHHDRDEGDSSEEYSSDDSRDSNKSGSDDEEETPTFFRPPVVSASNPLQPLHNPRGEPSSNPSSDIAGPLTLGLILNSKARTTQRQDSPSSSNTLPQNNNTLTPFAGGEMESQTSSSCYAVDQSPGPDSPGSFTPPQVTAKANTQGTNGAQRRGPIPMKTLESEGLDDRLGNHNSSNNNIGDGERGFAPTAQGARGAAAQRCCPCLAARARIYIAHDLKTRPLAHCGLLLFCLVLTALSLIMTTGACACSNPVLLSTWASRSFSAGSASVLGSCTKDKMCHMYPVLGSNCSSMMIVSHIVLSDTSIRANQVVTEFCPADTSTPTTSGGGDNGIFVDPSNLGNCRLVGTSKDNKREPVRRVTGSVVDMSDLGEDIRYVGQVAIQNGLLGNTTYIAWTTFYLSNGRSVRTATANPLVFRTTPCLSDLEELPPSTTPNNTSRSEFSKNNNISVSFIGGGDYKVGGPGQQLLAQGLLSVPSSRFIFLAGDLAYANNMRTCYRRWDLFFHEVRHVGRVPYSVLDQQSFFGDTLAGSPGAASFGKWEGLDDVSSSGVASAVGPSAAHEAQLANMVRPQLPLLTAVGNHEGGGYLHATTQEEREERYNFYHQYFPSYLSVTPPVLNSVLNQGSNAPLVATGNSTSSPFINIANQQPISASETELLVQDPTLTFHDHNICGLFGVVVLDTDIMIPAAEQTEFVKSSFTATTTGTKSQIILPIYHNPAYPSVRELNEVGTNAVREYFLPEIFKYHQHIPIVLEHHDHVYKRTYPLFENEIITEENQAAKKSEGIVFVGDGALGVNTGSREVSAKWYLDKGYNGNYVLGFTVRMAVDEELSTPGKTVHNSVVELVALGPGGQVIDSAERKITQ